MMSGIMTLQAYTHMNFYTFIQICNHPFHTPFLAFDTVLITGA